MDFYLLQVQMTHEDARDSVDDILRIATMKLEPQLERQPLESHTLHLKDNTSFEKA